MFTDTLDRSTPYSSVNTPISLTWGICPSDTGAGSASMSAIEAWSQSWKRGEAIPNFHKRRAKGELLPFTNFLKVETEGYAGPYTQAKAKYATYNVCSSCTGLAPAWNLGLSYDSVMLELEESLWNWEAYVQAAAAAIDGKAFDLLTWAAELRELRKLWELISGRWLKSQLAKAASRKTLDKRNQDISDTFVDAWLGARYGIRPLIADINNLNEALKANLDGKLRRFKERRGVSHRWTTTDNLGATGIGWGWPGTLSFQREVSVDLSIRGSVIADIDLGTFKLNPIQTGWELLPYSFVLDWFISVGKALGAGSLILNAKETQAAKGFTTTWRSVTESVGDITPTVSGWQITSAPSLPMRIVEEWRIERRIPTRVSLTPFVNVRLDPWKAIDLYALFDQLARKLR